MKLAYENWGATNTPRSLAEKNKTYERHDSLALQGLQELRDIAWQLAIK